MLIERLLFVMRGFDLFVADTSVRPEKRAMNRRTLRVYRSLVQSPVPLAPFQIAERTGIDSKSARLHLMHLIDKGYALKWESARHRTREIAEIDKPDAWMLEQIARKMERLTMRGLA